MAAGEYRKLATVRDVSEFRGTLAELGADLPCDDVLLRAPGSPLARPIEVLGRTLVNRFAIQPMEGWDGTTDGRPTEHTIRRWSRFGQSGAALIWGGEATAVRPDGRANPNQLMILDSTRGDLARLRVTLVDAHHKAVGGSDPLIGLQLTHSGRYAQPNRKGAPEPRILYHHPILDRRLGLPADYPVLTDAEIREIIEAFHRAARLAQACGFDFVDVKHCHGYLGHEFLSAVTRPGPYGGTLENRTRFLREIVQGIRAEAPGLGIAVRVSAFDTAPFRPDPEQTRPGRPGPGVPEAYCDCMPYVYAFGADPDQPTDIDLREPVAFLEALREMGITLVNITGGSPYYNPHIQRPALYPPSDGYLPPEDPLIGVARHVHVARYIKQAFPEFVVVGTGYSYLQDYLPHVSQASVREGWTDFVGLGRMVLAYPELPKDLLSEGRVDAKRLCRTFSDCTTAPRNGLVSGCYPLDSYYKKSPSAAVLARAKRP